jgi:hypothetical protein
MNNFVLNTIEICRRHVQVEFKYIYIYIFPANEWAHWVHGTCLKQICHLWRHEQFVMLCIYTFTFVFGTWPVNTKADFINKLIRNALCMYCFYHYLWWYTNEPKYFLADRCWYVGHWFQTAHDVRTRSLSSLYLCGSLCLQRMSRLW